MKQSWAERKAFEQRDILKRAADAGVQARKRGNTHVEMDNEQFIRLVDQRERFAELLRRVERGEVICTDLIAEIREALAGR